MKNKMVYVISYHWIDSSIAQYDEARLSQLAMRGELPRTRTNAAKAFRAAGWEDDGKIGAIWIPPFMFGHEDTWGLYLWHVKQSNNGTSWLGADRPHDFAGLREAWKAIEISEPVQENDLPF